MLNVKRFIRMWFEEYGTFDGIMESNVSKVIEDCFKDSEVSLEENFYRTLGYEFDQVMSAKDRYEFRVKYINSDFDEIKEKLGKARMSSVNNFANSLMEKPTTLKVKKAPDLAIIQTIAAFIYESDMEFKNTEGQKIKLFNLIYSMCKSTKRVSIANSKNALNGLFRTKDMKFILDSVQIQTVYDKECDIPYIEDIDGGVLHCNKQLSEKQIRSLIHAAIGELVYHISSLSIDGRPYWSDKFSSELIKLAELDTKTYLNYIDAAIARDLTVKELALADGIYNLNSLEQVKEFRCFTIPVLSDNSVDVYPIAEDTKINLSMEIFKYLYERDLLETLYIDKDSKLPYIIDEVPMRVDTLII